jgi:hypothetical protein
MLDSYNNYFDFAHHIKNKGMRYSPRGLETFELLNQQFSYEATYMFKRPGFSPALAFAELMLMVAGTYDEEVIKYAAPNVDISLYDPRLMYGPRLGDQVAKIVQALQDDPFTRRAILMLGDSSEGCGAGQPCTTSLQFFIRHGDLYTTVNMRSQDMVRGLPYDLVMFGGLAQVIANQLGIAARTVTINQGSAHVYTSTLDKMPAAPVFSTYQIELGFFEAKFVWTEELKNMNWKPRPSGIRVGGWVGEQIREVGYGAQEVTTHQITG